MIVSLLFPNLLLEWLKCSINLTNLDIGELNGSIQKNSTKTEKQGKVHLAVYFSQLTNCIEVLMSGMHANLLFLSTIMGEKSKVSLF